MRNFYVVVASLNLATLSFGQAQLPNSGFENWIDETFETITYEVPTPWSVGEACASALGIHQCSFAATKSNESKTGNYATKITADGLFGLSVLDQSFSDRPKSLDLQIKKSLLEGDKASIKVFFHNGSIWDEEPLLEAEGNLTITGTSVEYEKNTVDILSLIHI